MTNKTYQLKLGSKTLAEWVIIYECDSLIELVQHISTTFTQNGIKHLNIYKDGEWLE